MKTNNFFISIITLSKNDNKGFKRTLKSIREQVHINNIEWIIIDSSNNKNQKYREKILTEIINQNLKSKIYLRYINMNKLGIYGIYPSMNYGKKIAKGDFIIFMNSGDEFFEKNSLSNFLEKISSNQINSLVIFGQAQIISKKFFWLFPGEKLKNINKWLKFFEPNHQAMMISIDLARRYEFSENHSVVADGYWKRKIINNAREIIYLKKPVCKFYLDGVSSKRPDFIFINQILKNKKVSLMRKLIFILKFLIPQKFFLIYHYFQKLKSLIIDYLF